MNVHERATSLAATDLDFSLAGNDRRELDEHLASCDECRRTTAALRSDAASLRAIAAVAPPPRLRAAVATAAARPDRVVTRLLPDLGPFLRLATLASLVAALTVGLVATGFFAGKQQVVPPPGTPRPIESLSTPRPSGLPQAVVVRSFPTCGSASALLPETSDLLVVCPTELDRILFDGSAPTRLATGVSDAVVDGDAIWAVGTDGLVELDRTTGAQRARVPQAGGDLIAFGNASVWVVSTRAGTVTRVDPATHKIMATIAVDPNPEGILIAYGRVWVTNRGHNTVSEIDPATNEVRATIVVGNSPLGMAAAGGRIWVADNATGEVSRVDPATAAADVVRVAPATDAGVLPALVAVGDTSVWVVDAHGGVLAEIDAARSQVVREVAVPGIDPMSNGITALGIDGSSLWVADIAGTLREVTLPARP